MRRRKHFTNRRLAQASRSSTYTGGGFTVLYETPSGGKMECVVVLEEHGIISNREVSDLTPSPDLAKIHSSVAFRAHFGVSGEPWEYETRKLECICNGTA